MLSPKIEFIQVIVLLVSDYISAKDLVLSYLSISGWIDGIDVVQEAMMIIPWPLNVD